MDTIEGTVKLPEGLLSKFLFYGRSKGYIYAALSYIGRGSPGFWRTVARPFAKSKIDAWLARPGPHILNLGGGGNLHARWLTADIDPRADVFVDITRRLPFAGSAVDVVYLEEVIEHVDLEQARNLLSECYRIIRPGGAIRLSTPDLDAYIKCFDGSRVSEFRINGIFYGHEHRHIYGKAGMRDLLVGAGFKEVMPSIFRDAQSPFGDFDTHPLRFAESDASLAQYWDAKKPLLDLR